MFGVDSSELVIVAVLALIFIGPKELPATLRTVGKWVGRARAHARHFTSGIENMVREAELEEMEKKWRDENDRIMRDHPAALPYPGASNEAVMTPLDPPISPPLPAPDSVDEPQLPLGSPDSTNRLLP